jgi:RNA polymerase sigma factor (sigma-70 family)
MRGLSVSGAQLHPLPAPGPAPPFRPDPELVTIVLAARAGDDAAWTALVRRLEPSLRRVARGYRLTPAQVEDVVQSTWTRALVGIQRLREPGCISSWLITTTRREALRALQGQVSELLVADPELGENPDPREPLDDVMAAESRALLASAVGRLPERQRRLMELLMADPDIEYREISAETGMPIGSIGPTRARCLDRLAGDPSLCALATPTPAS